MQATNHPSPHFFAAASTDPKPKQYLAGTRFGTLEFSDGQVMNMQGGLIGFEQLHGFVLVPHRDGSAFCWLQSVEEPAVAFLMTNPWQYEQEYQPEVADADAATLALSDQTSYSLWTTVNIPGGDASLMTLNLAAPIVINMENRLGKQVVLEGQAYNIRHRVFQEAESGHKQAA